MRESEEDRVWKSLPSFMKAFGRHNATFFGITKASPDDDKHPGYPAGAPDGAGGQFRPKGGTSRMDIDKAVKHLDAKARKHNNPKDAHCAQYVRQAIQAGGTELNKWPESAKDYGPYLERAGFIRIPNKDYKAKKGDVVVFQSYAASHPHGHIQMYNGTKWVSDFVQNGKFYPGPGYEKHKASYAIYRP